MAEELGLTINNDEFEKAQAQSKIASQASSKKGKKDAVKLDVHDLASLEKNPDVPKTDDSAKFGELRNPPDTKTRSYYYEQLSETSCDCEGHLPRSRVPVIHL
jgi:alanyl-tRNA synthetase